MKKRSLRVLVVLLIALLLVPLSAVSAESNGAMECVLDITYDEYSPGSFYWLGTLSDCDLAGSIKFEAVPEEYVVLDNVMHFVEEFTIYPGCDVQVQVCDEYIKGKNWGVWNFSTFKFRANGWVKDASEGWAHLVGAKYHEMGTTSPYYTDDDIPITAPDGAALFVPAQRPSHALP